MSGIQRWECMVAINDNGRPYVDDIEYASGRYVLHSDHEEAVDSMTAALVKLDGACLASEQEIARLRVELADAHAAIESKAGWEWKKEADRLRAEVEGLRKDALQIAQTLAWQCFGECRGFSDGLISTHEALAIATKIQDEMGESA